MSRQRTELELAALGQYMSGAVARGLTTEERLEQLSDLRFVCDTGHIPESVFIHIDMNMEEADPGGYSSSIRSATDSGLAAMCQLMMGGLSGDSPMSGYSPEYVRHMAEHFKQCPECRARACKIVRSGEALKSGLQRLYALMRNPTDADE